MFSTEVSIIELDRLRRKLFGRSEVSISSGIPAFRGTIVFRLGESSTFGFDGKYSAACINRVANCTDAGSIKINLPIDFDLYVAITGVDEFPGLAGHLVGSLERKDAQHWKFGPKLTAEKRAEWNTE